ncbi:MAG: YbaN family protein [Leptospiraceae bacterium]|nr:YbaN family protein [Leptospiraceae bacterium]MDW8306788.1 YbaN family protein [Leptospiraceae bacterium]
MTREGDHHKRPDPLLVHHNPLTRAILLMIGTISLILGILGIFLPLLPTTPFLLLSAACYARSSRHLYTYLLNHRVFGPYIYKWRVEKRIPLRIKIYAIALILITVNITIFVLDSSIFVAKILVIFIALAIITYILRFPS